MPWILLGIVVLVLTIDSGRDDTDPSGARSGMTIYRDALTGCEYLGRWGLTPRMDANGKQICRPTTVIHRD